MVLKLLSVCVVCVCVYSLAGHIIECGAQATECLCGVCVCVGYSLAGHIIECGAQATECLCGVCVCVQPCWTYYRMWCSSY